MKYEAYTVSANDIEIWASIGVHPEEALVENCFRVSVAVDAALPYARHRYFDYEIIVAKVQLVFSKPHKVLEDLCSDIIEEVKAASPLPVHRISCEIKKMQPALNGLRMASLSASLTKVFE